MAHNPINNDKDQCLKCSFWDGLKCSKRIGGILIKCVYDPDLQELFQNKVPKKRGLEPKYKMMGKKDEEMIELLRMNSNKKLAKDFQVNYYTICLWRRHFKIKKLPKKEIFELTKPSITRTGNRKTPAHQRYNLSEADFKTFLENNTVDVGLAKFGVKRWTYLGWLRKYNISKPCSRRRIVLKQVTEEVLREKLKIFNAAQLARQFGITQSAMNYWFRKFKINYADYKSNYN